MRAGSSHHAVGQKPLEFWIVKLLNLARGDEAAILERLVNFIGMMLVFFGVRRAKTAVKFDAECSEAVIEAFLKICCK